MSVVLSAVRIVTAAAAVLLLPAQAAPAVVADGAMQVAVANGGVATVPSLAPLLADGPVYALGPVSGMRGEITVFAGEAWVSRVVDGKVRATQEPEVAAAFLVRSTVRQWQDVPLDNAIASEAALAAIVRRKASKAGIAADAPFPFIVEAPTADVTYHVVNRQPGEPGGHAAHAKSKQVATLAGQPVTLLGFWSDRHAGVFTHKNATTHTHVLAQDRAVSGHVDALTLPAGARLRLPMR